jgi:NitT/TauT family transport system substrate-binding protein
MKVLLRKLATVALTVPLLLGISATAAHAEKIRIALAETPSDELAAFFVALERAKANGLDYEWTAFSDEELATQAVLSGQMDIGFGPPTRRCNAPRHRCVSFFSFQNLSSSLSPIRNTTTWQI